MHYMEYTADDNVSQKPSEEHDLQDHLASDTTDDEQEDLPYDGILECYLVPSSQHDKEDKSSTPFYLHQALIGIEESQPAYSPVQSETTNDEALYSLDSSDLLNLSDTVSHPITQANENIEMDSEKILKIPTIIPDVLLRHITEGNLVNPSEFIDYETMPEISIVESSDETAISRKNDAKPKLCPFDEELEDFKEEYLELYRKENNSTPKNMTNESNSDIDKTSEESDEENESELIQKNVKVDEFSPGDVDKECKHPTYEPQRRPSYEMKYGQGQVHYKLPDFSKVPPKVKIPKVDNGAAKPVHTIKKTASSTNLIGQSFLIQDILDSMQPFMQPEQVKEDTPFLDQRFEQALVDSRINSKVNTVYPPASECFPSSSCQFLAHVENKSEVAHHGLSDNGSEEAVIEEPQNIEYARVPTEGERMTRLLMEQAQTLKIQVFQNFKSCLQTLEIDYLSTKEKHRDLQLQIYRTESQIVGEFDIDREVEGQIFRLGMLLEDIQEQINKSEENETESSSSSASGDALVLSHLQETEDVNDLVTKNNTDKVETRTTASETQIQQDSLLVKEASNSLHRLCLYSDISTGIIDHGTDQELSDHSTVNSVNQLAIKESTVISNDIVPFTSSGQTCKLKGQTSFSQVACAEDWISTEHSGFVEESQSAGKLKKDIGKCSLHPRYQEDEIRKTQRKFRKPRDLTIFVQEKAANLDLANCNRIQLNSEWLVSSQSGLFQDRSKSSISNRTNLCEASSSLLWRKYTNEGVNTAKRHKYPNQKLSWPSKLPLYVQNQSCLSNRLHHRHSNIRHYMPSSRSSGLSSNHSQLANCSISTIPRKRWNDIKPNNQDYRDNKILNYVLDNALRTAKNMQKTTERMIQKLATDLVNPNSYRSSYTV